jgi:Trypsin
MSSSREVPTLVAPVRCCFAGTKYQTKMHGSPLRSSVLLFVVVVVGLDGSDGQYHEVELEAVHANYEEGHSDHNVMLVKLKTPSGRFVQVINTEPTNPMDGAELHVLGFHRASETTLFPLAQTNMDAFKLDYASCADHFADKDDGGAVLDDHLIFCTSTFAICHGHEGSPVVDQRGRLVGMVAGGTDCDPRSPMLNVRVSAFGPFLYHGVCAMSSQPLASCPQQPPGSFFQLSPPPTTTTAAAAAATPTLPEPEMIGTPKVTGTFSGSVDTGIPTDGRRLQEQDFSESIDQSVEEEFDETIEDISADDTDGEGDDHSLSIVTDVDPYTTVDDDDEPFSWITEDEWKGDDDYWEEDDESTDDGSSTSADVNNDHSDGTRSLRGFSG